MASVPELYRSYASTPPASVLAGHAAARAAEALTPGQHLYLCGPNMGAGKTHLTVWTASRLVREHGHTALFVG